MVVLRRLLSSSSEMKSAAGGSVAAEAASGSSSLRSALNCVAALLSDKVALLETITDDAYVAKCSVVGASIGQHVRHSWSHIEMALAPVVAGDRGGAGGGGGEGGGGGGPLAAFNYDERSRGTSMETDRKHALRKIREMRDKLTSDEGVAPGSGRGLELGGCDASVNVSFAMDGDDSEGGDFSVFKSTVAREVAFSAHHSMHHMAMMKIVAEGPSVGLDKKALPNMFGMAPSTRRFLAQQQQQQQQQQQRRSFSSAPNSIVGKPSFTYFSAWFVSLPGT